MMLYKLAGKSQDTKRTALKVLWSAHRRGHIAPIGLLCSAAYRGHFGLACRLLGVVAYPFVLLRTSLMGWWDPLSERSFVWYPPEARRLIPVLKSNCRAVAPPSLIRREGTSAPQPVLPEVEGRVAPYGDGRTPEDSEIT